MGDAPVKGSQNIRPQVIVGIDKKVPNDLGDLIDMNFSHHFLPI
jgi:hypothetical protein